MADAGLSPIAPEAPPGTPPVGSGPGLPASASPPPPKRNRVPLYAAVAAVVVVILVLLLVTQVIPLSPASSSAGGALTFSSARPIADQSVAGYEGGGWALIIAAGLDSATAETIPTNSSASVTGNCTLTLASGTSSTLTIPAYRGSRTAGAAPVWEFLYRNGAGTIAIVAVVDAAASVIGTVQGSTCSAAFGLFSPVPASVIDSSQAAAAVASDASTFLTQYPNASAEFGLIGGISFLGASVHAEWEVTFTTCPVGPSASGTGTAFNATVNATNAQVIFSQTRTGVSCGSSTTALEPGGNSLPLSELGVGKRP